MNFIPAKKNLIKTFSLFVSMSLLFLSLLSGCALKEAEQQNTESNGTEVNQIDTEYAETEDATNTVLLKMTDGRKIIIELYPETAPITVENFKNLVSEKFYDGMIFHRVVADFVIQTGDPTGLGSGGSGTKIKGEFGTNGVTNTLSHKKGVVSMARQSGNNDSATSQFFICLRDCTELDGNYASFGKVIGGLDVVEQIGATKVQNQRPVEEQKIESIRFVKISEE